jgi:hypothetical protein
MTLTDAQKTEYWELLYSHAHEYVGSASLGSKDYQHLGIVIGGEPSKSAQDAILKYARVEAKSDAPERLFDAVLNTHYLRMAWKTPKGQYVELWSAYSKLSHDYSDKDRQKFVAFLGGLKPVQPLEV